MIQHPQQTGINELEQKLGVPVGLFKKLKDEDDWSFLIKTHALLELALAHLIHTELERPELAKFFRKLNIGGEHGKLEVIKSLKLLDPHHFAYLRLLTDLRNKVAHDIRNVGFNLTDYLTPKTDNQLREFALTAFCIPVSEPLAMTKKVRSSILANPRSYLWHGAMDCLSTVYMKDQIAERAGMLKSLLTGTNLGFAPVGALTQLALSNLAHGLPAKGLLD